MSVLAIPVPATINGLPFHPLIVHAVVVIIPLTVVGAIGISIWPAMRRHLGLLVLLGSLAGLVLIPFATSSGEKFRDELGAQQLVRTHQHYAEKLLPWTAGLVVLLALTMVVDIARRLGPVMAAAPVTERDPVSVGGGVGGTAVLTGQQAPAAAPSMTKLDRAFGRLLPTGLRGSTGALRIAQPVLGVLTVVVALVLAYYCYKTGDSGAKAVWGGR